MWPDQAPEQEKDGDDECLHEHEQKRQTKIAATARLPGVYAGKKREKPTNNHEEHGLPCKFTGVRCGRVDERDVRYRSKRADREAHDDETVEVPVRFEVSTFWRMRHPNLLGRKVC